MEKWDLPPEPIPSWLDAADEITHDEPKLDRSAFVVACMNALLSHGCDVVQACGVTANALNETGWGQYYRANNLGGWKITKAGALAYRLAHDGRGSKWWRAPGNKAPGATLEDLKGGDPPWCYYRAFDSIGDFLAAWLEHFVPRPSATPPYPIYKLCGEAFWAGREWFPLLVAAGYKGDRTKAHPDGAIDEHAQLCRAAATRWAQCKLGVDADGAYGPASREACKTFQRSAGLPESGELDAGTLAALASLRA